MRSDAYHAHMLLGLLDGFATDAAGMREHLRIAHGLGGGLDALFNRCVAEGWCGAFEQSAQCAQQVVERAPGDVDALRMAMFAYIQYGAFSAAHDVARRLQALLPGSSVDEGEDIRTALAIMRAEDLGMREVQEQFERAGRVAARHKCAVTGIYLSAAEGTIAAWHVVRATFEQCRQLKRELEDIVLDDERRASFIVINDFLPHAA